MVTASDRPTLFSCPLHSTHTFSFLLLLLIFPSPFCVLVLPLPPQNCLNGIFDFEHPRRVGLNNGVMLLDIDKMVEVGFIEECLTIGGNETLRFQLADQDIMNIYFDRHPDRLLWLPYWWERVVDECLCAHISYIFIY